MAATLGHPVSVTGFFVWIIQHQLLDEAIWGLYAANLGAQKPRNTLCAPMILGLDQTASEADAV